MKVGVFGDSFAHTVFSAPFHKGVEHNGQDFKKYHWGYLLAKKLGATRVDYHAQAGSSFYYSYNKICKLGHNYDILITTVSNPYRFPTAINGSWGINDPNTWSNFPTSIANGLRGWDEIVDIKYKEDVQESFLQTLENKFKNIIFVPSFPASFKKERQQKGGLSDSKNFSLYHFYHQFVTKIQGKGSTISRWENFGSDRMLTHIPTVWHTPISQILYEHLIKTTKLTVPDLPLEISDIDHYFLP
jgi:hypothetical protein